MLALSSREPDLTITDLAGKERTTITDMLYLLQTLLLRSQYCNKNQYKHTYQITFGSIVLHWVSLSTMTCVLVVLPQATYSFIKWKLLHLEMVDILILCGITVPAEFIRKAVTWGCDEGQAHLIHVIQHRTVLNLQIHVT